MISDQSEEVMSIMKYSIGYSLFIGLALFVAAQASASANPDADALFDRFRSVDWSKLEVGKDKDLSDESWKVRIEVENSLIAMGKAAVPTLVEACQDRNKHVRTLAAYALGCLNDRSAIPALMKILKNDDYTPARLMAVEALGRLGAKDALSMVQAAVAEEDPHVRTAARWALPRVTEGKGVGDALRELVVSNFDKSKIATAVVGKPAPDFALTDDSGKIVQLADFRGKKNVAIVFLLADW